MYNQKNRINSKEKITVNMFLLKSPAKKIVFAFLISIFFSITSSAQCAMCRAVLETEEGGVKAEAVNDGIVYLMAFPYILVFVIFYVVHKSRQKKKKTA